MNKKQVNDIDEAIKVILSEAPPMWLDIQLEKLHTNIAPLYDALLKGPTFQALEISVKHSDLTAPDVYLLSRFIKLGRAPRGFILRLRNSIYHKESVFFLMEAVISGNAPENLIIDLGFNNIDDGYLVFMLNSLSSSNAPKGLKIIFDCLPMSKAVAECLAQVITSGCLPQALTLEISFGWEYSAAIKLLEHAILQEKHPVDFKIVSLSDEIDEALEKVRINRFARSLLDITEQINQQSFLPNKKNHIQVSDTIVSHIGSFLHPKGKKIARNVNAFFHVRHLRRTPLSSLEININQVIEKLDINDVEMAIEQVLNYYCQDTFLAPVCKEQKLNAFISALQHIDLKENQILVKEEIQAIANALAIETVPQLPLN